MDAQNFLQHLFRSIVPVQPDEDDDMNDEMRPLEPIIPITTTQRASSPSTPQTMPAVDTPVNTANSQPSTTRTRVNDEDEDDSMPELQSVSNSSDEDSDSDRDADEVEMQAVEDDNDSSWTDDDDSEMPSLEPINAPAASAPRPNRRARVDDDEDEERDRRHPSQRVGNVINTQPTISASSSTPTPTPPAPHSLPTIPPPPTAPPPLPRIRATINIPGFLGNTGGPDPFRLFQQRLFQQNRTPGQPNAPNNGAPPGNLNMPTMFGGFAITLDINGTPVLHHHPADPNGQGWLVQPHINTHAHAPLTDFAAFRDFAGMFGLGFSGAEVEDPERAKRLVDGLEEVPVGLVRRLERVGGSGTAEEEAGGSGGDSGCAICWDRLLDGEGDGFVSSENKDAPTEGEAVDATSAAEPPVTTETETNGEGPSTPSSTSKEAQEPVHPKIVSLPCAHVFHASCLLPWFSRPNQTTCPTCRFNIDPENLTYVRRPRPAAPPPPANPAAPRPANAPAPTVPGATSQPPAAPVAALTPIAAVVPLIPNADSPANPYGNPTDPTSPESTEVADLAAVRETIAQRDRDMAQQRNEEFAALLGPGVVPPFFRANAAAGPSAPAAAEPVAENGERMDVDDEINTNQNTGEEEFPDPPVPDFGENATAPGAPAGANPDPAAQNNMPLPGTIHWGFDIFVGAVPPGMDMGMDMDDDEFEMDENMMDEDMEAAWRGDFDMSADMPFPHHDHDPSANPTQAPGAGATPAPAPTGAPGNNPHSPFAHFPHQLFPGMNAGRNVHVGGGVGTARNMNEAFASMFGGRGPPFGPATAQAIPTPAGGAMPQAAGDAPQAVPTPPGDAVPANGTPNANVRANARPVPQQQLPDFFSTLLNSVPPGALGRIVPIPVGQPVPPNAAGTGTTPPTNTGFQNPTAFQAPTNVDLPPLRHNDGAPGANAGAGGASSGTPAATNGANPPGPQPQNTLPPFANLFGTFPPTPLQNPGGGFRPWDGNVPHPSFNTRPRERKPWTLPPAPGPSLRQRIERREREANLRCYDISCGVGPSDEEPFTALSDEAMKQLAIRPHESSNADASVCPHTFHSSCLVTSERVSLKGADVNILGEHVEVSCSICRGVGRVSRADWDEGVQALA
jgi:hypothetical protein